MTRATNEQAIILHLTLHAGLSLCTQRTLSVKALTSAISMSRFCWGVAAGVECILLASSELELCLPRINRRRPSESAPLTSHQSYLPRPPSLSG